MKQPDFSAFRRQVSYLPEEDVADIQRAFDVACRAHERQQREDGSPYVTHVIAVAEILADWMADRPTIIAALLHDTLEDTGVTKEMIVREFGKHVATLVDGVTKFTQADLSDDVLFDRKIETLRKLFEVMRQDVRVALIKLADRLHNVRTIETLPSLERRERFARETLSIYYKLAIHLGMREVRRAFAEACVPYAYPEIGNQQRAVRDALCARERPTVAALEDELKAGDAKHILLSVVLQPRNILVFHRRLAERGGNPLTTDAFSVVIQVKTDEGCYQLLKLLHTLHRPVSGQFRDYIAAPSEAGYRSLHTTVTLQSGIAIEVRIRTPLMHEQAERGVTLFLFSDQPKLPSARFSWLQRSAELDLKTRENSAAFWEALESDVLKETIAVTVDRKRMVLPKGSTALDAAYAFYGVRAGAVKGTTLSGQAVALSTVLKDDDDLYVSFAEGEQVVFEWLQWVATKHARSLIVDVLKKRDRSEKILLGIKLLQKELDHYKRGFVQDLSRAQCQHAAEHFRREHFDDVLSMIGEGVIRARDVVFYLYPEQMRFPLVRGFRQTDHSFRLRVTGTLERKQEVMTQLSAIIRESEVDVDRTTVSFHPRTGTFTAYLNGHYADRLKFADFLDALDRQEWVSNVETMLPYMHRMMLAAVFFASFAVVVLDVVFFPVYQSYLPGFGLIPRFLIQALPLVPIVIANYYLLRLLRQYLVRMRNDRWFLGVGFLLNVIGMMLIIFRVALTQENQESLVPLIAFFVISLAYLGYRFFQTDALFSELDERGLRPITAMQWATIRRRKMVGYGIRLLAVTIWGLEPIYIRYTSVIGLSPFLRTFLLSLGVLIPSAAILAVRSLWQKRTFKFFALPYDRFFTLLVLGQVGHMYFKNASLVYTSGTNLLLFNNFSPLIGLLIAAVFWRKEIPYLKQAKSMLWVFLLAVLGGFGSSLLVYSNILTGTPWTILGDIFAMISMFFDVILVIGQIQYIKRHMRTDGVLLNLHIFFFLLLITAPVILLSSAFGVDILRGLNTTTLLLGMGIGLFVGFGQWLNYEAFKRIDGYLAYMMFNLSILITFVLEVFFVHSLTPNALLLLSGALIIGASVTAEFINSRCQKKGL